MDLADTLSRAFGTLLVSVLVVGAYLFWMRRRHAAATLASPHTKVGWIARQLGLRILQGDPETNLGLQGPRPIQVLLEGEPYGVRTSIQVGYRITDGSRRESADRIEVASPARRGRFEIRLARPHSALRAASAFDPRDPLPPRRFGDELDGLLRIEADDDAVPAMVAPHVGPLLAMGYVHVAGETGRAWFDLSCSELGERGRTMAGAYAFPHAEAIVHLLVSIAASLDGRPAPGALR
jgi:hypothetical protein